MLQSERNQFPAAAIKRVVQWQLIANASETTVPLRFTPVLGILAGVVFTLSSLGTAGKCQHCRIIFSVTK